MTSETTIKSVILSNRVIMTVIMTYNWHINMLSFRKLDIRKESHFQSMFTII